jgi:hypothetical protein
MCFVNVEIDLVGYSICLVSSLLISLLICLISSLLISLLAYYLPSFSFFAFILTIWVAAGVILVVQVASKLITSCSAGQQVSLDFHWVQYLDL